ncbi:glutaredoxin domain-containing protein [Conexibacter sp. DBS9H8]|uniref:glutaredoxin domain-containing protein n=1 Tax=Conexibacter sp. DBS9H8 TaxID=2937801 RepID=UPI00200EA08D|nr:glutaredoxin domain-containing protein [Conexibacter sp. DBS9H8]
MAEVTVYSTTMCPFCEGAKALLKKRGVSFNEIMMSRSTEDRDKLVALTGGWSFPQVVVGDNVVGGFEELRAVDRAGKLSELLTLTA